MALNFWKKNNNVEDNKATAEDCIKIIEGNKEETEVKEKKFNVKKALKVGVGVAAGAGALAYVLLGRKKADDGYTDLGESGSCDVESDSDESGTEA